MLGHEVAHAVARHGGERVSQQLVLQTGLGATQVALSRGDPLVTQSVTALLGAGATVGLLLPWGRAQESEADYLGMIYMAKAGYDPEASVAFWERFAAHIKQAGGDQTPWYLRTHPVDTDRINQLKQWMPEAKAIYKPR